MATSTSSTLTLRGMVDANYHELRRIAARLFSGERKSHTLQPTALVHEAFIRLAATGPAEYRNRKYFFAIVSKTFKRILIDYARRVNAGKRPHASDRVPLEDIDVVASTETQNLLILDEVISRLANLNAPAAHVVELRIFGGLSISEIADLLDQTQYWVEQKWIFAKVWMTRELEGSDDWSGVGTH